MAVAREPPSQQENPQRRHYDEMRGEDGAVRPHFRSLAAWLADTPAERVAEKRREADLLFHRVGITFAVYGEEAGSERLIPFDMLPHIIPAAEWRGLRKGCASEPRPSMLFCKTYITIRKSSGPAACPRIA